MFRKTSRDSVRIRGHCQVHCSPHTYGSILHLFPTPVNSRANRSTCSEQIFSRSSTCTHEYWHLQPSHRSQMWTVGLLRENWRAVASWQQRCPYHRSLCSNLRLLLQEASNGGFPSISSRPKMAAPGGSMGVETQVAPVVCNRAVSSTYCLPLML